MKYFLPSLFKTIFSSATIRLHPVVLLLCQAAHQYICIKTMIWIDCECAVFPPVSQSNVPQPPPKCNSNDSELCLRRQQQQPLCLLPSITTKWITISRTFSEYNSTDWKSCLFGDMNNDYIVSYPVPPMKDHFKTFFQVQLYQLDEFFVQEDLNNEDASLLCSVTDKWSFQDHLPSRTLLMQRVLYPGILNNKHVHSLPWFHQ